MMPQVRRGRARRRQMGDRVIATYFRVVKDLGKSPKQWQRYMEMLFDRVPLKGERVLDVGGGGGLISFYAAVSGATEVLCLEPSAAGSNPTMEQSFRALAEGLPQSKVKLDPRTFQQLG